MKGGPGDPRRGQGSLGRRLVFIFVTLALAGLGGSGWVLYRQALDSLENQLSSHLKVESQMIAAELARGQVTKLKQGMEGTFLHQLLRRRMAETREALGARRIYVFDRSGRSLLDTEEGKRIGREIHLLAFHKPQVEAMWGGEPANTPRFTDESTGDHYMTGYAPIRDGRGIVAGVGVDIGAGYMDAILGFKRSVYLLAGFGTLLTLLVGAAVARHITGPIHTLVTAAREIGRGNLRRAVKVEAHDEIGYLGQTMEEMRRKLLERDAQLRQMLAGVAHEIRNPLSGIEIYAGLIADELPGEDPRREHIHKVIAQVHAMNLVISEFLHFARPPSPQPGEVVLSQLVDDAGFLLSPEMEAAGVTFRTEVSPEARVYADPEQVKRAVVNLMKNAVQAMADGGALTVRAGRGAGEVALEVEDTGPGMAEEVRQRLFEPFFTTREKGSGLGLAIVQQAAETNAGRVEVESAPGRGSVFRLVLPAAGAVPVAETEEVGA
ncbi:MAG: ATP-binding protein [Gemmatimonadaceae bacterium]|nr:ATP-binding protein [Gemmatimonadaceae bacterium]